MLTIKKIVLKSFFSKAVLKYVGGYKLFETGINCISGPTENGVNADNTTVYDLELKKADYYYFYVESSTRKVGVAFEYAEGEELIIDNEFFTLVVEDAIAIDFSEKDIDSSLTHYQAKEFQQDTSWHFANWLRSNATKWHISPR